MGIGDLRRTTLSYSVHADRWGKMASVSFMHTARICFGATIMIVSSAFSTWECLAQDVSPSPYPGGFVIAKSRFNNGAMRGLVRRTALGWEVQPPNGRWIYCRRSCEETLRVETVDFFQTNAAGSGQLTNECGVFGCLDLKYPR